MKIFIGSDHRGFDYKTKISNILKSWGHEVVDLGTHQPGVDCDYPEFSYQVATSVVKNSGARGILICMTGLGQSIAANKVPGTRATLCYNTETAKFARQHNNSNILVLSAKYTPENELVPILKVWLEIPFEGGRHERRLQQLEEIEKRILKEFCRK